MKDKKIKNYTHIAMKIDIKQDHIWTSLLRYCYASKYFK